MKKIITLLFLSPVLFAACKSSGRDSVEKADSANQVSQSKDINSGVKDVVSDTKSSLFLVRVANAGMAESEMSAMAHQRAYYPPVKDFAGMLHNDHSGVNDKVKSLAAERNIFLPLVISEDKQDEINDFGKNTGKIFDREFVRIMIKNHESSIDMFEKVIQDGIDPDIISFAVKTLPALRMHLDSAKSLQRNMGKKVPVIIPASFRNSTTI